MSSCKDILPNIQTTTFCTTFPTSWISETFNNIDYSIINQPGSATSGSDPDPPVSKHAQLAPPPRKKVSKRKPRVSKRSSITYINADVDNFRQLVQQVTGVRFGVGSGHNNVGSVVRPEAHRPHVGLLPTLDTSAGVVGPTLDCGPRLEFDGLTSFPTLDSWKVIARVSVPPTIASELLNKTIKGGGYRTATPSLLFVADLDREGMMKQLIITHLVVMFVLCVFIILITYVIRVHLD